MFMYMCDVAANGCVARGKPGIVAYGKTRLLVFQHVFQAFQAGAMKHDPPDRQRKRGKTIMAARSVSGVRRVVQNPQRYILCVGGRDLDTLRTRRVGRKRTCIGALCW